jgi:N-methylhydantoinase A
VKAPAVKAPASQAPAAAPMRRVYFGPQAGWLTTPILSRADLITPREGPAIVEEYDATCVVPPGARAALDAWGDIVMEV